MSENDRNNSHTDETESVSGYSGHSKPPSIKRLGSFRINAVISAGGMGTVYRAYDESMKRSVALKVLHPALEVSKKTQSRFAREAWIAGQLEHPNIIKVYSRGEENRLRYIAMELADGGSLADHIRKIRKSIPSGSDVTETVTKEYVNSILKKFIDLANASVHIHSKGFIHRDIKPHNILISGPDKHFKFTDFGIAHAEDMTNLTKAGDFIGTVKYMSPELLTAHRAVVDKRTDIYSLGVTLYEALTLNSPFEADSEEKYITEILTGHSIPARKRNKRISKDLETVLMKATHQDPEKRYQSAAEFAEDLTNLLASRPIKARREGVAARGFKYLKRNWRPAIASLAAAILLVIISYQFYHYQARALDTQRIVQTLKTAVQTRTSPFDIEPDWERLSEVLYRKAKSQKLDSAVIWYFRACSVPTYSYRRYSTFKEGFVKYEPLGLDVFNPNADVDNYSVLAVTFLDLSLDGSSWLPYGTSYFSFGVSRPECVVMMSIMLSKVADSISGLCQITIRRVNEYYVGAGFFDQITDWRKQIRRSKREQYEDSLIQADVVVDAKGDSLFPYGLGLAGVTTGRSGREQLPEIRQVSDLATIPVFYTDTVLDTFSLFIFNEYPDGFPREIKRHSPQDWAQKAVRVANVSITKRRYGFDTASYHLRLKGAFSDSIAVPVVGEFRILNGSRRLTLLTGLFELTEHRWGRVSLRLGIGGKIVAPKSTSRHAGFTEMSMYTLSVPDFQMPFEELVELGEISAQMEIHPSIDAARFFGDVDEFWGHPLTYDIQFQVLDSTRK